jgi:putative membrane protein insertion efficiency factor
MKQLIKLLINIYRLAISPFKPYPTCRFYPTCSSYAKIVVKKHGALKGGWLAVKRICKCHPWHAGGIDLPPE